MNQKAALLGGIGVGIGLMYLLDPGMGRRRRALVRDKAVRYWNRTSDAVETTSRDVSNRIRGATMGLRSGSMRKDVDDAVLEARVRSRMGRVVSHPSAIEVSALSGRISLGGDILRSELDTLLRAVTKVPGVHSVENNLQVHDTADNVPSLQGPSHVVREDSGMWSPSTRLIVGAAGTTLAVYGIVKAATHRPEPRWRRMLSAAGFILARVPRALRYVPKGVSRFPRGIKYVPKGMKYVPKGISYVSRGISYMPRYDEFRAWSPAARIIAASAGAALTFYSIAWARNRRRRTSGWRRILNDVSNFGRRMPEMSMSTWRRMPSRVAHGIPWVH